MYQAQPRPRMVLPLCLQQINSLKGLLLVNSNIFWVLELLALAPGLPATCPAPAVSAGTLLSHPAPKEVLRIDPTTCTSTDSHTSIPNCRRCCGSIPPPALLLTCTPLYLTVHTPVPATCLCCRLDCFSSSFCVLLALFLSSHPLLLLCVCLCVSSLFSPFFLPSFPFAFPPLPASALRLLVPLFGVWPSLLLYT